MKLSLVVCGLCVLLGACVRPPAVLSSGPFAAIGVVQGREASAIGQRVRWGGEIVATTPKHDETCFEIVSRPLDDAARPRATDQTDGRFLACAPGFYDPAVYSPKRELTVVGIVKEPVSGKIGEFEYTFPRVAVEALYLWSRREPVRAVYVSPWIDPFWGPYWYPYRYQYPNRYPFWGWRPHRRRR